MAMAFSTSARLGQNHAVTAKAIGRGAHTSAQGVKNAVTRTALTNGQIVGSGNASRWSGVASTTVVIRTSLVSSASPVTCVGSDGGSGTISHSGSRARTIGILSKLYAGGGDGVAHSSVPAPQGLSPARVPLL